MQHARHWYAIFCITELSPWSDDGLSQRLKGWISQGLRFQNLTSASVHTWFSIRQMGAQWANGLHFTLFLALFRIIYIYIIDITTLFQVISVRLLWYVVMIICDAENLEWESSRMNEGNGSGGKNPCKLCKWNRHCLSTHPSLSSQQCKDYNNYMPSQEVERGRAESGCISLLALLGKHYDTWQSTIGVWTCEFAYWWKPSVQMEGIDKR